MIRFEPDTWLEALLRYLAMAAPNGNVYVEIAAPDLRFAAIMILALALGLMAIRRRVTADPTPAVTLLALIVVSTIPWLLTSGNGRYWIPMLLCAGPVAVGLIWLFPLTRAFRAFLALTLVAAQAFLLMQSSPWDAWTWAQWREAPYFQVDRSRLEPSTLPTTYVTVSTISYSLIAPQFPAASRWLNITSIGGTVRDTGWAQDFLAAAKGNIKLVAPTIRGQVQDDGGPSEGIRKALDLLLAPQRLALAKDARCELLRSKGLVATERKSAASEKDTAFIGFWVCPLRWPVDVPPEPERPLNPQTEAAFASIEQACPRFFAPGAKTTAINGGWLRHYAGSDMKLYVLDDGQVLYKFWRALNPVLVGTTKDILGGNFRIDCSHIRGRSGLPWDREI